MSNKRIVVTGGNGFIGTNLIEFIHGRLPDVTIINIDKKTSVSNNHLTDKYELEPWYIEFNHDISDDYTYYNLDACDSIDIILNLAAESHVDRSIESIEPFIQSNIIGTVKMAQFAIKHNIPMINISTDEVYGELTSLSDGGFTEDTPISPRNPYAASKASADMFIKALSNQHSDWNVITTHCSNNFGKFQDSTKFIPVIIDSVLNGDKIPVYGTGENVRDWLSVYDHCSAIYILMDKLIKGFDIKYDVYNIGSGNCMSNVELIEFICKRMGVDPDDYIEFISDPRGSCHDKIYKVNSSRIKNEHYWQPTYTSAFTCRIDEVIEDMNGRT